VQRILHSGGNQTYPSTRIPYRRRFGFRPAPQPSPPATAARAASSSCARWGPPHLAQHASAHPAAQPRALNSEQQKEVLPRAGGGPAGRGLLAETAAALSASGLFQPPQFRSAPPLSCCACTCCGDGQSVLAQQLRSGWDGLLVTPMPQAITHDPRGGLPLYRPPLWPRDVFASSAREQPALLHGRIASASKPSSIRGHTERSQPSLGAPSTLEMGNQHWRSLPPCCSPRCDPEPADYLQRTGRAAAGMAMPLSAPSSPAPPRPQLLRGAGGVAARAAVRRPGCLISMNCPLIPAAQLLAFTLDRWVQTGIECPGPVAAQPASSAVERRATQDSRHLPLTPGCSGARPSGRFVGALFCSSSPTSWLTPTQPGACSASFAPREAPLSAPYARERSALEELIAGATSALRRESCAKCSRSSRAATTPPSRGERERTEIYRRAQGLQPAPAKTGRTGPAGHGSTDWAPA